MAEYFFKMIANVVVGIYIAVELGPHFFGILTYALAVHAIFHTISRLGMDATLVKELSAEAEEPNVIMGTAFRLMLVAAVISGAVMVGFALVSEESSLGRYCMVLMAMSLIFQAPSVIDYRFQAALAARYTATTKSVALLLSSALKLSVVYEGASLEWISLAYVTEAALIAGGLVFIHLRYSPVRFLRFFNWQAAKNLLALSWPLIISGLSVILYNRIDQLMIRGMLGLDQVGYYSAASKIYEAWIAVPYVVCVSLLPAIVRLRSESLERYELNLARLLAVLVWTSLSVSALIFIFSEKIILTVYGTEYQAAAATLSYLIWGSAFVSLGAVSARYFVAEGTPKKIAIRAVAAVPMNVVANYILIPRYGIEGAAVATLITVIFANLIINYMDSSLRPLRRICNKAALLRLRS